MGTHLSKVRSLSLDTRAWEEPALLHAFAAGGNAAVNAVLEARSGAAAARAGCGACPDGGADATHAAFIRSKYSARRWVRPSAARAAPVALRAAVARGDAAAALAALLCGAPADATFGHDAAAPGGGALPPVRSATHLPPAGEPPDGDSEPASPATVVNDGPASSGRPSEGGGWEGGPASASAAAAAASPRASLVAAAAVASGCTLLHVACGRGDTAVAELLLQWGARVDAADADGATPLLAACAAATQRTPGAAEAARRLLRAGADAALRDRGGRSAREAAAGAQDELLQSALQAAYDDRLALLTRPLGAGGDGDGAPGGGGAGGGGAPGSAGPPRHRRMPSAERLFSSVGSVFARSSAAEEPPGGWGAATPPVPRSSTRPRASLAP